MGLLLPDSRGGADWNNFASAASGASWDIGTAGPFAISSFLVGRLGGVECISLVELVLVRPTKVVPPALIVLAALL